MNNNKGLAQRLRPRLFGELLGQELVGRALSNALRSGRIAQAFLFSGPRGVGKTSAARILARALLCEERGDGGEPCNQCKICKAVLQNACADVYEMDAASHRGIDSIRELRENVKYAPSQASGKVYIVDEVHMLTTESFNALLKTLEEPPQHVTFIFATTEVQRLPATVLSRCQRFEFSGLSAEQMAMRLAEICKQEEAELSERSLLDLARRARGSMRDALVGLDQVLVFQGKHPDEGEMMQMLGLMKIGAVWKVLEAILLKQPGKALAALEALSRRGGSLNSLLEQLMEEISGLSMLLAAKNEDNASGTSHAEALSATAASVEAQEFLSGHQGKISADVLQQLFYVFLEAEQQMHQSRFEKLCLEMAILKGCQLESLVGVEDLLAKARAAAEKSIPSSDESGSQPSKTLPQSSKQNLEAAVSRQENHPPLPVQSLAENGTQTPTDAALSSNSASTSKQSLKQSSASHSPPPCQDPRWLKLAKLAEQESQALAMLVRHSEVTSWKEDKVLVIPSDTPAISSVQRKTLQQLAEKAWGTHPSLSWQTGAPHSQHTLAAVQNHKKQQLKEAKEQAALQHPVVQKAQTLFPSHSIVDVKIIEANEPS